MCRPLAPEDLLIGASVTSDEVERGFREPEADDLMTVSATVSALCEQDDDFPIVSAVAIACEEEEESEDDKDNASE